MDAGVVDELLSEAMAPVLRDLRSAGIASPRVEDRDWTELPDSVSAMLWSPDGSGVGVHVSRSLQGFERVAMVADQVQEWAIEELWGQAPTNWPMYPHHPDSHPMTATTRDGTAVWACPADRGPFAPIGAL